MIYSRHHIARLKFAQFYINSYTLTIPKEVITMPDKSLTNFITEARKRGFSDKIIKEALLDKGWPIAKVDSAFESLMPKFKSKNQVCIFLSDDLLSTLEK